MADTSLGTAAQLRDPNYTPPLGQAIPLGIQHVLAMFVSNVTPPIIIAFAAGFGFGSPDTGVLIYMIQMAMLFAGIATLFQTIGMGPVGARLPIVQGTSFAYLPVMIPAMAGAGVAGLGGLMTGVIVGGLFHFCLGFFIKRIRFALPPLVTGLIVLMIGLALIKVGIQYAAGGVPAMGKPEFGSLQNWFVAGIVIVVTLAIKFFSRGFMSVAAVLVGLLAGYVVAMMMGMVSLDGIGRAGWFLVPSPFAFGFDWNWGIIIGMCLMAFISAIETVGDTSGITKGGAGREATDDEVQGATFADGLGTALGGVFGGLPNTSFSQNVGLISMTGVMSRHVVTIGAIFLIVCGFVPKIGALISTVPIEVLGGGVIVMFGMVASAGVNMLSDVNWNRRNMVIFATALSIGLGLQLVPEALQHTNETVKILMTSGLLPAAFIAIVLNLFLPAELDQDGTYETQVSNFGAPDNPDAGAGAGLTAAADLRDGVKEGSITAAGVVASTGSAMASGIQSVGEAAADATDSVVEATENVTGTEVSASTAKGKAQSTKAGQKVRAATKTATRETKAATAKASAKTRKATGERPSSAKNELTRINGVGPVNAEHLRVGGFTTLKQVASGSIKRLNEVAQAAGFDDKSEDVARDWKAQAKSLTS